ncbi:MAG: glycosyltransferase [Bacteroidales bacterium]|nr:glycosyltransferase [Bacteroidales bacterium]MDD4670873.1 glycosyltransferase [Bacteroidales bacterium]
MQNKKKTILIIGSSPGHIGGVGIHLSRLVENLRDLYNFDYVDESKTRLPNYYNLRSFNLLKYLKKVLHADIVHIHSSTFFLRAFHIVICKLFFRKHIIVTIHHNPIVEGKFGNKVNTIVLPFCQKVIFVNKEGYNMFNLKKRKSRYLVFPAFIPPIIDKEKILPEGLLEWILNKKKENYSIISSNAWKLVISKGEDLYGIDMCIELMKALLLKGEKCAFIFVLSNPKENVELLNIYKQKIKDYQLYDVFLIWEDSISFVRLIQESDLIVRPTNTDGDALSIREALFLNKQIVASDVVDRPEGTIIFHVRDNDDFCDKVSYALKQGNVETSGNKIDYYLNFYRELYSQWTN